MKDTDDIIILFVLLMIALFVTGLALGCFIERGEWTDDCNKHNIHIVSGSNAYDCTIRKAH